MRRKNSTTRIALAAALLMWLLTCGSHADEPIPASRSEKAAHESPRETLVLKNHRSFRGLVEEEGAGTIKFVQILQHSGSAMRLVMLRVPHSQVERIDRLPAADHEALADRVRQIRERRKDETTAMQRVALRPARRDGWPVLRYRGPWFLLDSSADEETTRRSVVRMEQIFEAYREALPPRCEPKRILEIVLWGSPAQYHAFLARRNADMANPAFFSPEENAVIAGLNVSQHAYERDSIRAYRDAVKRDLSARAASPTRGRPAPEGASPYPGRRGKPQIDPETSRLLRELATYDRQASEAFGKATEQTFAMLYHEAFHAYLENYVYPRDRYDVPRWLNEGLAQVFENGVLEGDELHIDTPPAALVGRLQLDMVAREKLELKDLLEADERLFLVMHPSSADSSRRNYLYSWGVAHYLAVAQQLLGSKELDAYCAKGGAEKSSRERFEKLIGQPLETFAAEWKEFMLAQRATVPAPIKPDGELVARPLPSPAPEIKPGD